MNNKLLLLGLIVLFVGFVNAGLFDFKSVEPPFFGCSITGCTMQGNIDMNNYAIYNASLVNASIVDLSLVEYDPVFTAENGTLWNAIISKLNITDQRYNDTQFILEQLLNYYNKTEINSLLQNFTYNETDPIFIANNVSIWQAISNKLNINDQRYNDTTLIYAINTSVWNELAFKLNIDDQRYNDTALINSVNSSLQSQIALQAADNLTQANLISSINNSLITLINQSNCVGENTFSIGFDGTYNYCNAVNTSALDIPFSSLNNYPAPCSPGYAITGLGDLVTCTAFLQFESDPIFVASNTSIWSAINSKLDINDQKYNDTAYINNLIPNYYNKTEVDGLLDNKLNINDQRYNETVAVIALSNREAANNATQAALINAKASPGSCSSGYVVQNTTTGGVQCVAVGNIGGSGTAGRIAKFSSSTGLTDSIITESSGNVGIGTTVPGAKLDVAGTMLVNRESVAYYRNVIHKAGAGSETGTLKITLPKTWSNTMMKVKIEGYNYAGGARGTSWSVVVGGYNYVGTPAWYNYFAEIHGAAPFNLVRLAHDGTHNVILLGTTSSVWSYPRVAVTEFMAGSGSITGWDTGWSISWITDETGITNIVTPTIDVFRDSTGNVGIGTTSPGAKLDVAGDIRATGRILSSDKPAIQKGYSTSVTCAPCWLRIASNSGNRANAIFTLNDYIAGGGHSTLTFVAGISYNYAPGISFTVLNHNYYGGPTFTKVRILDKDTYDPQYLEVYVVRNGSMDFWLLNNYQSSGWTPLNWGAGSVPTGYSSSEYDVNNLFIVGDYDDRVTIARGGNVGIGTTTPGNKLDVAGGLTVTGAISTGKGLGLSDEGPYKRIQSWDAEPLAINPLGNNVGIGTTTPGRKLDVADRMRVRSGATGTGGIWFSDSAGNELSFVGIESESADTVGIWNNGWRLVVNNNGNVGIGTTSPSNRLTVSGNADITGNLGIGTASPSKKLTVSGDAYISGNVSSGTDFCLSNKCLSDALTSYVDTNDTAAVIALSNREAANNATQAALINAKAGVGSCSSGYVVQNTTTGGVQCVAVGNIGGSGTAGRIAKFSSSTGLTTSIMKESPGELTIEGNVGIGTATPTANLSVAGNITVTTQFLGNPSDTASVPSFSWSGDNNVGIYRPTTDTIGFTTGGLEKMRITSTGNVGIGTTTPTAKLSVAGNIAVTTQFLGNPSDTVSVPSFSWSGESGLGMYRPTTDTIGFAAHGAEMMRITSDGVGIGTATPNTKLEVNGGIRLNTTLTKPTCSATYRGTMWMEKGGSNVADKLYICMKSLADTYSWVQVAMG